MTVISLVWSTSRPSDGPGFHKTAALVGTRAERSEASAVSGAELALASPKMATARGAADRLRASDTAKLTTAEVTGAPRCARSLPQPQNHRGL